MQNATNRMDTLRTLNVTHYDVAFATAFGTLVGGSFLTGFIIANKGGDLWIGLLAAIPSLLGVLQIIGASIGRRFNSFKAYVSTGGLIWRLFFLPLVVLPLTALTGEGKLVILFACLTIANTASQLINPIYNDWLAEMVPPNARGAFFGRRNAVSTGVGSLMGIIGGLILDHYRGINQENIGFSAIFTLGLICASISFFFYMKMKDIPRPVPIRTNFGDSIKSLGKPFRDPNFRPLLRFLTIAIIGQQLPGALFAAYGLEVLKLPFTVLQILGAMQSIGVIASVRFWGFCADRFGNKPVLAISAFLLCLNLIPWILCVPNNPALDTMILIPAHLMFGTFWGGVNITQFSILLSVAPEDDRATYVGAGSAVSSLVAGVAPFTGALILSHLRPFMAVQSGYRTVFWIACFFRFICPLFLARLRERGSTEVRTTIAQMRQATPTKVRALRKLSQAKTAEIRGHALEELAAKGFAMATDEMVKALQDPSPQVRRTAAYALSSISDPVAKLAAANALVAELDQHPEFVEEEVVDALAELREPTTQAAFLRLLDSPRSSVRRAAARGLGRLGNPESVPALAKAAEDDDGDLRRVAIRALRGIADPGVVAPILRCLDDPRPSVRIAAAEAVSELRVKDAAPRLREILAKSTADEASAFASALGVCGEESDIPLILTAAQKVPSRTSRRQMMLGIAQILGVTSDTYRLLLREGMERDTALLDLFRTIMKRHKRAVVILDRFSTGDEIGALKMVGRMIPSMAVFGEIYVEEAFLVAAPKLIQILSEPVTPTGPSEE